MDTPAQTELTRCGEPHPYIKGITCVRFGKCPIDLHLGIDTRDPFWSVYIEWGKARERWITK